MTHQPLAVDLFCGLGGWTDGLLSEGWKVIGFDIEQHVYGNHRYPAQLVVQDVLTLHGAQFKGADLIVASPPCTEYSYMAMPWTRAKQIRRALLGHDDFPQGYKGSRTIEELTRLFDACFHIQQEACDAAGRHIPMVVENVRGAQEWVGRAAWNYGSFYLWGNVPALMPMASSYKTCGMNWSDRNNPNNRRSFTDNGALFSGIKIPSEGGRFTSVKQPGLTGVCNNGKGSRRFQDGAARSGSKSNARKMASAMIAKIPHELSAHIAKTYKSIK